VQVRLPTTTALAARGRWATAKGRNGWLLERDRVEVYLRERRGLRRLAGCVLVYRGIQSGMSAPSLR
jgi:hypothetical protein